MVRRSFCAIRSLAEQRRKDEADVRSYPADPHTEVLAKFVDRLEFTVMR
jgi:hypothetical protein